MTLHIPKPNPKQQLFFSSTAKYTGYGGARGGGKSWAVRVLAVLRCLECPGLNVLLLRRTLPELRENHLLPLRLLLGKAAAYSAADNTLTFPAAGGGRQSRIKLGYCAREDDVYQYQGQEYDLIFVEECTHFTWAQVQFLMTCNRTTLENFTPRMYFTGNPGGVGHGWFRRLFVKRRFAPGENPDDYLFIPATVEDNPVLMRRDPGYAAVLDALPERLRRAHRYGDWDVFEGQFFEEFSDRSGSAVGKLSEELGMRSEECRLRAEEDRRSGGGSEPAAAVGGIFSSLRRHAIPPGPAGPPSPCEGEVGADPRAWTHVIRPFEVPPSWTVYRGFDFGYARPFSVGWWAVDHDGRLYRILELYGCGAAPNEGVKWTPDRIFAEVKRIEREHRWFKGKRIIGVADPSIWDASRGESVADTAARRGVYFTPGDNRRLPGWMQMHYRLAFDEEGYPMMYIFDTCKAFIRTVPELVYDRHRPEDLDTNGEDHVADETRYICMARPMKPRELAAAAAWDGPPELRTR